MQNLLLLLILKFGEQLEFIMSNKLIPYGGNDNVYTPKYLTDYLVSKLEIPDKTTVLDPCCGQGVFEQSLREFNPSLTIEEFDLEQGKDFLELKETKATWIISNPPWSKIRLFCLKAYELEVQHVAWLTTINHIIGMKARMRDMKEAGYAIRKLILVSTPSKPWPSSGFQLGLTVISKGYLGEVNILNED